MRPGSSQWCLVTGQEAEGTHWVYEKFHINRKQNNFLYGWWSTNMDCKRICGVFIHGGADVAWPYFKPCIGLGCLQKWLPACVLQRLCTIKNVNATGFSFPNTQNATACKTITICCKTSLWGIGSGWLNTSLLMRIRGGGKKREKKKVYATFGRRGRQLGKSARILLVYTERKLGKGPARA